MEISFPAHIVQDKHLTVADEDLEELKSILVRCFLDHVTYHDFRLNYSDNDKKIVEFCKKYGVDLNKDRISFFSAILEGEQGKSQSV